MAQTNINVEDYIESIQNKLKLETLTTYLVNTRYWDEAVIFTILGFGEKVESLMNERKNRFIKAVDNINES